MTQRPRLDELLVQRGLFEDIHEAQAAVLAGQVVVGEHCQTSAGLRVAEEVPIRIKKTRRFVSRGGEKLAAALDAFHIDVAGLRCVDLGCSSGGFTDCLLQAGAASVCAVDVGYGQFDWSLRCDERVNLFERTNVHGIDPAKLDGPFDCAVADLSFISLTSVLDDVSSLLVDGADFIALVKPQFEAGKDEIGEGGVVCDAATHTEVLERVCAACEKAAFFCVGLTYSPLMGPQGNIEFLLWMKTRPTDRSGAGSIGSAQIEQTVHDAHRYFGVLS
ncbi:MAG: TlyA family RNA methyltransferase [Coriobacteriaceae bacterium]|nr:TlyA family RNA methyltransferase [Coriobacteriaceae bacterium]